MSGTQKIYVVLLDDSLWRISVLQICRLNCHIDLSEESYNLYFHFCALCSLSYVFTRQKLMRVSCQFPHEILCKKVNHGVICGTVTYES